MKPIGLLFFLLFLSTAAFTQNKVSYNMEPGIDKIEQQYIDAWKKIKKINGFKIQITSFSGANSKNLIDKTAEQFKQQFPNVPCQVSYYEPYFRLRAGNYSTKLEAYKALKEIIPFFPGAFIVKDLIDIKNQ